MKPVAAMHDESDSPILSYDHLLHFDPFTASSQASLDVEDRNSPLIYFRLDNVSSRVFNRKV